MKRGAKGKTKPVKSVPQSIPLSWRERLALLNSTTVHSAREIEIIFLTDLQPKYFEHIDAFQKFTYPKTGNVKCLIYEELLYLVKHYPGWDMPYVSEELEDFFKQASDEAKEFLKRRKPIPLELIAQLIKLRGIFLILQHVYDEINNSCDGVSNNQTSFEDQISDTSSDMESLSDTLYEGSEEDDNEEEVVKPTYADEVEEFEEIDINVNLTSTVMRDIIRAQKMRRFKKHGKQEEVFAKSNEFVPTIESLDAVRMKKPKTFWSRKWKKHIQNGRPCTQKIDLSQNYKSVEVKKLFLMLTGFYEALLFDELYNIGFPVSGVIYVANIDDQMIDPTCITKIYSAIVAPTFCVTPIYYWSIQEIQLHRKPILLRYLNHEDVKEHVIWNFWKTFKNSVEELNSQARNIFCSICRPICKPVKEDTTKKTIFDDVNEILQNIPKFKQLHSNYLNNLHIFSLGQTPPSVQTSKFHRYRKTLDKIPPECFKIEFVLNAIVEEINFRQGKFPDDERTATSSKYEFPPEDLKILFSQTQTLPPLHCKDNVSCESETMNFGSCAGIKNKLMQMEISNLKKSVPALLWSKYPKPQTCKMEENQYYNWCTTLGLSPDDVKERLQVTLFKLFACLNSKPSLPKECSKIDKYFPRRRDAYDIYSKFSNTTVDFSNPFDYRSLKWCENLTSQDLLHKICEDFNNFPCMDHFYIKLYDAIFVKFHNKADAFGIISDTWRKSLRSKVSMYHFFKHVVHNDVEWLKAQEVGEKMASDVNFPQTEQSNLPSVVESNEEVLNHSLSVQENLIQSKCEPSPKLTGTEEVNTSGLNFRFDDFFLGYDFDDYVESKGVTTMFQSLEGFRVRVDKVHLFQNQPHVTVKFEAKGHHFVLHANPFNKLKFHFNLSNGMMVHFSKAEEAVREESVRNLRGQSLKLQKSRVCQVSSEITPVRYKKRHSFQNNFFLMEDSFEESNLPTPTSICGLCSYEDVRVNCSDRFMKKNSPRKVPNFVRNTTPRFNVVSSALHKYSYRKLLKVKFHVQFANCFKTVTFIPKIRLESCRRTKCHNLWSYKMMKTINKSSYDINVCVPSDLQVRTVPTTSFASSHVIQFYTEKSSRYDKVKDEVARIFFRNGTMHIVSTDGNINVMGSNSQSYNCKIIRSMAQMEKLSKTAILQKRHFMKCKFIGSSSKNYLTKRLILKKDRGKLLLKDYCSSIEDNRLIRVNDRILKFETVKGLFKKITDDAGDYSSIDNEGKLTTIYPDGTKITSWFEVEKEMVVVEDCDDENPEVDPDDYSCNFLIPKSGGFISIKLCWKFEHPNYATVEYADNDTTSLTFPDGTNLCLHQNGNVRLNVKQEFLADVSSNEVVLRSNFCRRCYDCCKTVINVKPLYMRNTQFPRNNIMLEANDNFMKIFKVTYDGECSVNENFNCSRVKHDCLTHILDDSRRFYVMNRDFSGRLFWDHQMYVNEMTKTQYDPMKWTVYHLNNDKQLNSCEFYEDVHDTLRSSRVEKFETNDKNLPLVKRRLIKKLPDPSPVLPLFYLIKDINEGKPNLDPFPLNFYMGQIRSDPVHFQRLKKNSASRGILELIKKIDNLYCDSNVSFQTCISEDTPSSVTIGDCYCGENIVSRSDGIRLGKLMCETRLLPKIPKKSNDTKCEVKCKKHDKNFIPVPFNSPNSNRDVK